MRGGGSGATSDGKRSEVRIQRSGKAEQPFGESREQRSEVRGIRTAGTAEQPFNANDANETQRAREEEGRHRRGIVDAPAGRIGSEGNGTASALSERSYRAAERPFGGGKLKSLCAQRAQLQNVRFFLKPGTWNLKAE